ncbi:T-lymphocyte surface antigen Ly-9-like [Cebidichthys violaceus]|uniref:T-lymphocyte surface antigen Ly-9-like n=1 Tax=Cebidichthys violaceus TaxID=271503 RepID=UPI0035CAF760
MFIGSSLDFPSFMSKMWPRETSTRLAACLCVLLAVVFADSEIKVYGKVGDEVVLRPGNSFVTGTITSISWRHKENWAADWEGASEGATIDYYRQFKERGHLNITTGELTITGLTLNDSGLYTSEVNDATKTPDLRLIVISPVPKPTVSKSCDAEVTLCTLTCDGDTADAGPVTYRWRTDDEVRGVSPELRITKDDFSGVKELSCEMHNPVSEESSRPIPNPFSTALGGKLNISTGVTMFIALLVALLLVVAFHRCKAGMWFFQKSSMPWESDFWKKQERPPRDAAESNGTTAQENGHPDEETPLS